MPDFHQWHREVSRKLSLRDLYILFSVAEQGSMSKAAARLGMTQSAVSQSLGQVEETLGVRLFDRNRRGVEPTVYGRALLDRSRFAFDELRTALQEIDQLQNAGTGEICIGCPETLAASVLPIAIESFSRAYPSVRIEVDTFYGDQSGEKLKSREVDLVFARGSEPLDALRSSGEFDVISLFDDHLRVVVGADSPWRGLGAGDLADLKDAPWIMLPYGWGERAIPAAFRQLGLPAPRAAIRTFSVHLRLQLVVTGRFVTALPASILRQYERHFDIVSLPIEIPNRNYDVAIITVQNRTRRRLIDLFIKDTIALFSDL